ncbi:hypothetical protein MLD38_010390 [Melastoma candidum]|nr:hypothetical protein MLD38_010390 [Melastoma candidum]
MAKPGRSESVNLTNREDNLETSSAMNDNPSSAGLMNDPGQLDIVREWIFRNYSDLVGHGGVSSNAPGEDEESSQFSPYHPSQTNRRHASMDGSGRGSQMGSEHAELLRKLEDLRLEISRIYYLPERTSNTVLPEDRTMHNSLSRTFSPPNPAEQHPYTMNHFGQFPLVPRSGANMPDLYNHLGYLPNYPTEYQDRFKQPMQKASYQFAAKSVLGSPIRDRMEFGEDLFAMHPQESFPHPHLCSCFSCSQTHHPQFCSPVHQTTFGISGIPKSPSTSDLYHRADSFPIWPLHNIPSVASTPARSLHSRLLGSWPSDAQSDMDNLRTRRRSLIVHQSFKKFDHPLAGGAPFTSCPKCSELLKLPQVFKLKRLSMQKLQCGKCFKVFRVDLGNRKRATFMRRKFPLPDENGFQEAGNDRNESPDRHIMADGIHYEESDTVKALPIGIGNTDHEFCQEKNLHGDQRENKQSSASMNHRSKSFTSVSSEDPILSNNVLRGRPIQDISTNQDPPKHKELSPNVEINRQSSVSSQNRQLSGDVNAGRIPEENSEQITHAVNQELNASTYLNSKSFTAYSVTSETEGLLSNAIVKKIPEEEYLKINANQDLSERTDQNSQSFTASSVSLEEQNLADDVNVESILQEEPQRNDQMEHQDLKNGIVIKRNSSSVSSVSSKEPNLSHDVTSGFDGDGGASEEPLADNLSSLPLSVDTINNHPDSFAESGQSQTRTGAACHDMDTASNHKENTVTETDVDFSFISCLSSSEFTEDWLSVDENSQTNVGRWSESSSASFVRQNFKELSRYLKNEDNETTNVTINGHPITKRNLKKAEMLAGKVLPGNYWYDYYCGFWGVMGEHCLGIIPPFIEEFNYPMRPNCAAGNTDVFVNGRELRELDLELLSGRGLPTTRNRSYKIHIDGTVYDDRTGEELKSLGLLAPSVLKAKKGFGMGVPAKYDYSVNRR